jgi:hypothetical protein
VLRSLLAPAIVIVASWGAAGSAAGSPTSSKPKAGFMMQTTAGPLSVTFRAVQSGFPAPVTSYEWVFGDGAKQVTKSPQATHQYKSAGEFTPEVIEHDSLADTASATGSLSLFGCGAANPCDSKIAGNNVSELAASGPTGGQAPGRLDLFVAAYRIAACEAAVGWDVSVLDRNFTGNLTITFTYHPAGSSDLKVTC